MKHCDVPGCSNIAGHDVRIPSMPANLYNELCDSCTAEAITMFTDLEIITQPRLTSYDKAVLNAKWSRQQEYQRLASYKQLEVSPLYASALLTVADAEELERKGVPSPISGDLNVWPARVPSLYADVNSLYPSTDSLRQAYRGGRTYTAGERRK